MAVDIDLLCVAQNMQVGGHGSVALRNAQYAFATAFVDQQDSISRGIDRRVNGQPQPFDLDQKIANRFDVG